MSITIHSDVARYHAVNVARKIGPNVFDKNTLIGFYQWLDNLMGAPKSETEKVKHLVNSAPCDYSYTVVARHPFLLKGYEYRKNKDVPEEVSTVFSKLFSNLEGHAPYSKDDLENLLDSLVTLVGYDVAFCDDSSEGCDLSEDLLAICSFLIEQGIHQDEEPSATSS